MDPDPSQPVWNEVDAALEGWLAPADDVLARTIAAAERAGLPAIAVAPVQGRLLEVLARAIGARRILEIGTLAGYSTIWLARALPADGRLVTLEIDPARAALARDNLAQARLAAQVDVLVGPASETLAGLTAAHVPPFDLIFIDADKERSAEYLDASVALARAGTLIVVDNVVRGGRLVDPDTGDAGVDGVRRMMARVARHPRLAAAGLQTVGTKGYDGLLVAVVGDPAPAAGPADPLDILVAHDAWATRELLNVCSRLSEAQWHQRFEIGPGSLHDTLTHIVAALRRWADRIHGPPRDVRPSIEDGPGRSVADVAELFEEAAADLAAAVTAARRHGLTAACEVLLGDQRCRFTRMAMVVHVTTHGMHHRSQCLNMLRRLAIPGISDRLPEIDVLDHALLDAGDDVA